MSLRYKHETSVENLFKDNFEEAAREKEHLYTSAPLDGQDRLAGADYLFTNHASFVIVEFKYRDGDIRSEKRKEKRLELCNALIHQDQILPLHNKCHFVAWSEGEQEVTVQANIYFNEVCNKQVWKDKFKKIDEPNKKTRQSDNDFIDSFFDGNEGASFDVFDKYLKWLLTLGDKSNTDGYLELLITNPFHRRAAGLPFTSVSNMQKWFLENSKTLSQKNSRRKRPGGPGGRG